MMERNPFQSTMNVCQPSRFVQAKCKEGDFPHYVYNNE